MKKYLAISALVFTVNANAGLITSIDEATVANGNLLIQMMVVLLVLDIGLMKSLEQLWNLMQLQS